MKKMLLLCFVVLCNATTWASGLELFGADSVASVVQWVGSKKILKSQHTGTIQVKNAELLFKSGVPALGVVVIDMTTIKDTDLTSQDDNKKLVGHLSSADFFDVQKFPIATLEVSSFTAGNSAGQYTAMGNLRIKDKTNPLNFPVTITRQGDGFIAKGGFKFDRTKFGLQYGSDSFFKNLGDKVIADEVELSFQMVGKLKK